MAANLNAGSKKVSAEEQSKAATEVAQICIHSDSSGVAIDRFLEVGWLRVSEADVKPAAKIVALGDAYSGYRSSNGAAEVNEELLAKLEASVIASGQLLTEYYFFDPSKQVLASVSRPIGERVEPDNLMGLHICGAEMIGLDGYPYIYEALRGLTENSDIETAGSRIGGKTASGKRINGEVFDLHIPEVASSFDALNPGFSHAEFYVAH